MKNKLIQTFSEILKLFIKIKQQRWSYTESNKKYLKKVINEKAESDMMLVICLCLVLFLFINSLNLRAQLFAALFCQKICDRTKSTFN